MIEVVGVITDYVLNPFSFKMTQGEVATRASTGQ
jgi:hypothetical protein